MISREIPSRRYRMDRRAAQVDRTRRRIVESAVRLHAEQGVAETSWAAIGKAAHVSTATVYRHFPTIESLVPACAEAAFEAGARLPTADDLDRAFSGLVTVAERLRHVITESCRCFERGEGWLDACRREARHLPPLAEAARTQDRALDAIIARAVGQDTGRPERAVLTALLNFPFWKSLVDSGVPRASAPGIITDLALSVVGQTRR
jgi:AcrR family transcriptional regulator